MGQSVTVIEKPSSNPEVLRFEANRSLTGMGHERYYSLDDVVADRTVDVLARRILEHGGVESVHVNSSMITVRLAGGNTGVGLSEIVTNLFRFYGDAPEVEAVTDDAPVETVEAEAEAEAEADAPVEAVDTPAEESDDV